MSRFVEEEIDKPGRFSLGLDQQTSCHYLSIPVANRLVDYDEYYRLTTDRYQEFLINREEALRFAQQCRLREHDDLLILKPGGDRGSAI